jgi:hypothetical protein
MDGIQQSRKNVAKGIANAVLYGTSAIGILTGGLWAAFLATPQMAMYAGKAILIVGILWFMVCKVMDDWNGIYRKEGERDVTFYGMGVSVFSMVVGGLMYVMAILPQR